jgi:hypothetical protein
LAAFVGSACQPLARSANKWQDDFAYISLTVWCVHPLSCSGQDASGILPRAELEADGQIQQGGVLPTKTPRCMGMTQGNWLIAWLP